MATIWPFGPNIRRAPYEVSREYRTDIIVSRSGKEQRRALRQTPRRRVEYLTGVVDDCRRDFDALMMSAQRIPLSIPDRVVFSRLPFGIPGGNASVIVDPLPPWVVAGAELMLVSGSDHGARTVESVAGTTITFEEFDAFDWPPGTRLHPALDGYLAATIPAPLVSLSRGVLDVSVTFEVDPGSEPAAPTGHYTVPPGWSVCCDSGVRGDLWTTQSNTTCSTNVCGEIAVVGTRAIEDTLPALTHRIAYYTKAPSPPYGTNDHWLRAEFVSTEGTPTTDPFPTWSAPTLGGREVFLTRPDRWRPVDISRDQEGVGNVDYGFGRVRRFFPISFSTRMWDAIYTGCDFERSDLLRQLFDRMQGRRGEFHMPTWTADLVPTAGVTAAGTTLSVAGAGLEAAYDGATTHKAIAIRKTDGAWITRTVTNVADISGGATITVGAAWGQDVGLDDIDMVCWLPVWRFASDTLTMSWLREDVAEVRMAMQMLEDLPADAEPGIGPVALEFVDGVTSSSQTFTMDFGAPAADRYMLLALSSCFNTGFPQNFNGVSSIGGVTATLFYASRPIPDTGAGVISFWIAAVPAGTSGDVVINPVSDHNRFTAAMYRLTGDLQSLTPYDSHSDVGTTGDTSFPMEVAEGGALVVIAFWLGSSAVPALVLSSVTNDYSAELSIIKSSVYGSLVSEAGETVTIDVSEDSSAISLIAASIR